jgi:flagellar biosynthesis protein FlhG
MSARIGNAQRVGQPLSIAVASGKGGTGKTIIAATIAQILDHVGFPALLMDADAATAGMTYYFIVKKATIRGVGLTEIGRADIAAKGEQEIRSMMASAIQPIRDSKNAYFLGIGNHREFYAKISPDMFGYIYRDLLNKLQQEYRWIIVDCRGGIDRDSMEVYKSVDEILLVLEPDYTSLQATRHLVDILAEQKLASKIRGFMLNKVISPSVITARANMQYLLIPHLSSIPLDEQAMEDFMTGEIPAPNSRFGTQVWAALHKVYPDWVPQPERKPWTSEEFPELSVMTPDSVHGGTIVAGLILILAISSALDIYSLLPEHQKLLIIVLGLLLLGLFGSIEPTRRVIGSTVDRGRRKLSGLIAPKGAS